MAINNVIDLDQKLSLTKSLKIAEKVYEVTISDEIDQALTELTTIEIPVRLRDMTAEIEKLEQADSGTDTYKKFTQNEIKNFRDKAIGTLDIILGKNEGQRVYKFYGKSTKALLTIISLLQAELEKVMIDRKYTADKHYRNRHKKK